MINMVNEYCKRSTNVSVYSSIVPGFRISHKSSFKQQDHKPFFWKFVIYKSQIVLENRIYTIYEILPP